jgi:Uncharacterized protein containing a von Willebrand factor type A (vWA) domain
MTTNEYIDERLAAYDEAFDFYMDCGEMSDSIPPNDILGGYIQSVIDDNPQLSSQDPTWKEVLKDDLMFFLSAMLEAFVPMEENHKKEQKYIENYKNAKIEKQRELWAFVSHHINQNYQASEVNIDGYIQQFKDNDTQAVIESLCKDWKNASDRKLDENERKILVQNQKRFENNMRNCGRSDFERIKKSERMCYRYPALNEIVKLLGREQALRKDEKDDITTKYIPVLPSHPSVGTEIEEITAGNDLAHMIPIETAILSEPETELLFYRKYVAKQLQIFANRPPMTMQEKQVQKNQEKPRLELGPIIVALDTSGSMNGKPIKIASYLLMQLLLMAKRKHRKCFLITFSIRAKAMDLTPPARWKKLDEFLSHTFSGGTDGEEMLRYAIDALNKRDFSMADVLIISDFEFLRPADATKKRMEQEHGKGTRFYGLQIGNYRNVYDNILDKIWELKSSSFRTRKGIEGKW